MKTKINHKLAAQLQEKASLMATAITNRTEPERDLQAAQAILALAEAAKVVSTTSIPADDENESA